MFSRISLFLRRKRTAGCSFKDIRHKKPNSSGEGSLRHLCPQNTVNPQGGFRGGATRFFVRFLSHVSFHGFSLYCPFEKPSGVNGRPKLSSPLEVGSSLEGSPDTPGPCHQITHRDGDVTVFFRNIGSPVSNNLFRNSCTKIFLYENPFCKNIK